MIGPVHEKLTRVSVNAMRKMLMMPVVRLARLSILFAHDEGNSISNAPKKEMANTTSSAKNARLNTALVLMALSAPAPNTRVIINPRSRYITIIEMP